MDPLLGTSKLKKFIIPLLDVLKQTPAYVTLFKDLRTQRHKAWTHIFIFLDAPLFDFMNHKQKRFNILVQLRKVIPRG